MCLQVAACAVQFLHRFQIIAKLNSVRILACLQVNQRLQLLGGEYSIAGPLDLCEFVLPTGSDRDIDINHGFLGIFLSYFGLGLGEGSFEVASLEINGEKIP